MATAAELKKKSAELEAQLAKVREAERKAVAEERRAARRAQHNKFNREIEEAVDREFYNLDGFRDKHPQIFERVVAYVRDIDAYEASEVIAEDVAIILDIVQDAVNQAVRNSK